MLRFQMIKGQIRNKHDEIYLLFVLLPRFLFYCSLSLSSCGSLSSIPLHLGDLGYVVVTDSCAFRGAVLKLLCFQSDRNSVDGFDL